LIFSHLGSPVVVYVLASVIGVAKGTVEQNYDDSPRID